MTNFVFILFNITAVSLTNFPQYIASYIWKAKANVNNQNDIDSISDINLVSANDVTYGLDVNRYEVNKKSIHFKNNIESNA